MQKGFSNLLRSSRLSSLPKAVKTHAKPNVVPQEQVIQTTPASFYRRDFGLKRAMPERMHTPYVTVKALDTMEGMTDFDFGSSFHLKQKRFQETGAFISSMPNTDLFSPSAETKTWGNMSTQELKELVQSCKGKRKEFIQWALQNESKQLHQMLTMNDSVRAVQRFLQIQGSEGPKFSGEKIPVKGNAGLGYLLPGAIQTTPNSASLSQPKSVSGRLVASHSKQRRAAIGGFVAQTISSFNARPQKLSEAPRKFVVTNVRVRPNGGVDVTSIEEQLNRPASSLNENFDNKKPLSGTSLPNMFSVNV